MKVISLGAGVQSTTMALMAKHGELETPDYAIFADTGWEPKKVYEHLDWLEDQLPFEVIRVKYRDIREDLVKGDGYVAIPFHLKLANGERTIGRRECTYQYKLRPLRWMMRQLLHKGRRDYIAPGTIECWIGISTDEAMRMKLSTSRWITNRWPLIEKKMNRIDCRAWLERHDYPQPVKSSCIGCPLRSNSHWRDLRNNSQDEWEEAVRMDREIRRLGTSVDGDQFMHPSCIPLDEVDLSTAEDHGQLDLFNNECEGLCGI